MFFTSDLVEPLRMKMEMEKDDFADLIGVGRRTVDLWESGKVKRMRKPARDKMIRLHKRHVIGGKP